VPTALAIHPLSKLRDLSKLRGILANRIKHSNQPAEHSERKGVPLYGIKNLPKVFPPEGYEIIYFRA
jgi:hypothetical protein